MKKENKRTALLLINLGTPNKPTVWSVARFLNQFLNDKHVIDIPWVFRRLLVNFIIIPFRVRNSTRLYKQLWLPKGSPLFVHTQSLTQKLQQKLSPRMTVFMAMRYQKPAIAATLKRIKEEGYEKIIVLPLFPQLAASTTSSIQDEVGRIIKKWGESPQVQFIEPFYAHPGFWKTYADIVRGYNPETYDFILFSFHGLPNKHIEKLHPDHQICDCRCDQELSEHGRYCYRAACYHSAQLIANKLNLPENKYLVTFQSRLSSKWISPFSDQTLIRLAEEGYKRVLVVAPSFVADCLETNIEIGVEYKRLFMAHGGQELTLVRSLNDSDEWVEGLQTIVSDFQEFK